MKSRFLTTYSIVFLMTVTAVFLWPPGAHAFWYGTDIMDRLDYDQSQGLYDAVSEYAPALQYSPFSFGQNPYDNNPNDDVGVTINKARETWDGYTLISDFEGNDCEGLPGAPPPIPWTPFGGWCGEPGANPQFCCEKDDPNPSFFCRPQPPTPPSC